MVGGLPVRPGSALVPSRSDESHRPTRRRHAALNPHAPAGAGPDRAPGPEVTTSFASGDHVLLSRSDGAVDGPEIALVHGVGLGADSLRPLAAALAPTAHVTWVELPGFGSTPTQDPIRLMADQSDFLAAFLRSRGVVDAVLVGHSMGSGVVAG